MALSEEKEKELVEKVELRIALADTPEKYQQTLDIFLAPLLLKLSSNFESVRKSVFDIIKDVLIRFNALKTVTLPVDKLLLQAKTPNLDPNQDSSNVRLYSLLLVSKGIDRMDNDAKKELIPKVMDGISLMPINSSSRLFHILCKLILSWKPPLKGSPEEDEIRSFLKLENSDDLEFLLSYFTKFFLLIPAKPNPESGIVPRGYSCPGLNSNDVSFFTYNAGVSFTQNQLLQYKSAIFKFVTNGFVPEDEVLVKFLCVVSADNSDLSDSAKQNLKRLSIPYEDNDFISFLIRLYIGDKSTGTPPVKPDLQERIMSILNSSIVATEDRNNVSLICSIGLNSSNYKLRSLCLEFIRLVAKYNYQNLSNSESGSNISGYSTSIASLIRNNLHTEGWPRLQIGYSTPNFNTSILQRRLQYETLGDILRKDFELVEDMSYIEFLFDSLKGDLSEFISSIQEALTSLTIHLKRLPSNSKEKLRKILKNFLKDDYELELLDESKKDSVMACRYISIKFANAAFDFDDPEARLLNILGTARTNRFDVIEEAHKGLNPYWFRVTTASNTTEFKKTSDLLASDIQETKFPDTREIVEVVLKELKNSIGLSKFTISKTLGTATRFIKQSIISNAIYSESTIILQDENWSLRIEKAADIDEKIDMLLYKHIIQLESPWYTKFIILLLNEFVLKTQDGKQLYFSEYEDSIFGQTLLFLLKYSSRSTLSELNRQLTDLFEYLLDIDKRNDTDLDIAANSLGIISTECSNSPELNFILQSLENNFSSMDKCTLIYTASYALPRLILSIEENSRYRTLAESLLDEIENNFNHSKIKKYIPKFISQIAKHSVLLNFGIERKDQFISKSIEFLSPRLLSDESSIEAIGILSIYSEDTSTTENIFEKLFDTHTSSQVELLFSVGEALSVLASRWESKFLSKQLDVGGQLEKLSKAFPGKNEKYVLEKVMEACDNTKPSLRKASCIWLLSIVQYCGSSNIIKENCRDIHMKFLRFLGDRDEFVQESASRGLSLVYELGGKDLKEDMISGLLTSFMDTSSGMKMTSGSVSNETQLFENGTLNIGDDSVRTYKDILNLASEVGDPSLVYKFMALSKNSALWSSRKGIAFGLGAIMSKVSLDKMLVENEKIGIKLIPKLFRYRFDPNTSVSNSMNDIWKTLVPDSSTVINFYFEPILSELLSDMSNKEWRVREASTSALLQLVQTQPKEKLADKIIDIWTMAFRTMDDIKESVREVGTKLTTALAKILARSVDIKNGATPEASSQTLKIILPFLLGSKGINSDAEDIRSVALKTLLDLVKNAGPSIKEFAPQLVYEFTLLFSSIEPQAINYLALNAENYKLDSSMIDAQRSNVVSNSPLFNAINLLIINSDDSNMESHVNNAIKAVRKSVGLPSKVAASIVLNTLVKKYVLTIGPFCGKLLKCCVNAMDDRNDSVKEAFAVSFGHINRISSLDKAIKYANMVAEKYFSSSSISDKKVVGTIINSVLKYANTQFNNLASIYMPLVFIASNDPEEKMGNYFKEIWIEGTTSGTGTVKLYLPEIMDLLEKNISSSDFSLRHTCAKSVSRLCLDVDTSLKESEVLRLFGIIIKALEGRSWNGKEAVADAIVSLVLKFKDVVISNIELQETITKTLCTEVSRKNEVYVRKVIFPFASYLGVFSNDELIAKFISISQIIIDGYEPDAEDAENSGNLTTKRIKTSNDISKKSSKENIKKEEFLVKLLRASSKLCKIQNDGNYPTSLLSFIVENISLLYKNDYVLYTWRTQLAASEIGSEIVELLPEDGYPSQILEEFRILWEIIFEHNCNSENIENVKLKMVMLAGNIISKFPDLRLMVEKNLIDFSEQDLTPRIEAELKSLSLNK
ncbi:hypothetical protein Kpol_1070p5 [Vanderwaltozyma polyspora DSM 70294]|uniref:Proteasome component ECM29 n=1 Tax=Vanderwaltozyma polyspora (strain ATCC 22028 / DSM 70294 / BCRC 21397 / CBS 2163 / NBRC 10782 / NRRL Y-8283 / UCD 57-17) TaxID=436907 RepID=A7TNK7_VANPO|nr:uncharacterized protein Kpol_1070p5 [Vanderwaltozyma polyspora DSM 70294]EDO16124.1 hypothetical protein Kpol_1070p5 [Vanderwaltozyma polyspora DSM 70294]